MKQPEKPLRAKDRAYCEHYLQNGNTVAAYKAHIATGDGANASANAWAYHRQAHIQEHLGDLMEHAMAEHYGSAMAFALKQAERYEAIFEAGMTMNQDALGVERPESLPAALGAANALGKLFAESSKSTAAKLARLKAWQAIQDDLALDYDTKEAITQAILRGKDI